jgi:probable F420-dependent oxidoreductase
MVLIGFGLPVSGVWATPDDQIRVARRAEQLGYRSLWTFQRLLVPAEPDERAGAEVYRSVLDPVVSLANVAGHTERARLGLAVVNMPFVSPILLAKQIVTLDVLSRGRLDAGLGIGWSPEEYAASGTPFERRGERAEEYLRLLDALLTDDLVDFDGRFYRVPPARFEPKPVQRPRPPILLGGGAPPALRRAGRLADGWISASLADPARLGEAVRVVSEAARDAGRDPSTLRFVARCPVRPGPAAGPERRTYTGSYEDIRADIDGLAAQGITEAFVDLNWDPAVGSPDADHDAAMRRAMETLEALAPA